MNRRERFYAAVAGEKLDRVPVTAWQHFVTGYMSGEQSASRHCEFFKHYGFDLAKCVSDYRYPMPGDMTGIITVDDFDRFGSVSIDHPYLAEQVSLLENVRKEMGEEWPVIDTTFDPIQQILRRAGFDAMQLIFDNPGKAKPMLEAATETVITYVRKLNEIGVDGVFYSTRAAATQKSTQGYTQDAFEELLLPYDTAILEEMKGMVRMLHTCKNHLDLSRVDDYPHEVLSWADHDPTCQTIAEVRATNDKCLMGGINQSGVIEQRTDQIRHDCDEAIAACNGQNFILSPGCTIGSNAPDHVLATIASYARP